MILISFLCRLVLVLQCHNTLININEALQISERTFFFFLILFQWWKIIVTFIKLNLKKLHRVLLNKTVICYIQKNCTLFFRNELIQVSKMCIYLAFLFMLLKKFLIKIKKSVLKKENAFFPTFLVCRKIEVDKSNLIKSESLWVTPTSTRGCFSFTAP